MDGLEDWRAYRGNRRRIEGDFWRAAVLGGGAAAGLGGGGAGGLVTGLEADDGAAALN